MKLMSCCWSLYFKLVPTTKNQIVSKNAVFKPISTIVLGVQNLNESFVVSICKPLWLFPHQNFYVIYIYLPGSPIL